MVVYSIIYKKFIFDMYIDTYDLKGTINILYVIDM